MPLRTRTATATVPIDKIGQSILILRGQRVLLDSDLAALYGVTTKRLNEQVKRNIDRFPEDFMFSLRAQEWGALRSQSATSKGGSGLSNLKSQNATSNTPPSERGGRRSLPNAFTEHGAIMAASILNSPKAIEMSVYVVRAFVRLRDLLSSNKELARQFAALESRLNKKLAEHDAAIAAILSAIRQLMNSPVPKGRGIGFTPKL
jgi:hypothetical protein